MSSLRKNKSREFIPDEPKKDKSEKYRVALQVIAKIYKGALDQSNTVNCSLDNAMLSIMKSFDEKNVNLSELRNLRKNFYLQEDYKTEDELYNNKICGRSEAIVALISYRMWLMNDVVKKAGTSELSDFMNNDQTLLMNQVKVDKSDDVDADYLELMETEIENTKKNMDKLGENMIGVKLSEQTRQILQQSNEKLKTDFEVVDVPVYAKYGDDPQNLKISFTVNDKSKAGGTNLRKYNNANLPPKPKIIIHSSVNDKKTEVKKEGLVKSGNQKEGKKIILKKEVKPELNLVEQVKKKEKMEEINTDSKQIDEDPKEETDKKVEQQEDVKMDENNSGEENQDGEEKIKRISNAEKKKIIAELRQRQNEKKKVFSDDNTKLEKILHDIKELYDDLKDFDARNDDQYKPSADLDDKVQFTWSKFLDLREGTIAEPNFLIKNFVTAASKALF